MEKRERGRECRRGEKRGEEKGSLGIMEGEMEVAEEKQKGETAEKKR